MRPARTRLADAAFGLVAAGIAGNALRMRSRVRRLAVLAPAADAATASDASAAGFAVVSAAGVAVDPATVAAAVRHAHDRGLDVVDLVPADLPSARLIELATHHPRQPAPVARRGHRARALLPRRPRCLA